MDWTEASKSKELDTIRMAWSSWNRMNGTHAAERR